MSSSELTQAKRAASKLFETSLPASDMAAVASTSGSNTGLTRDHAKHLKFLRLVISTMTELPGQRILIFISPGFLTFSEEAMELKSQLLQIASQANVTINAIDVRGLYTTDLEATNAGGNPGATANKTMYRQKSASLKENVMAELTEGTGGIYFHNSNALASGLNSLSSGPKYLYNSTECIIH
jgi:VWFA-related protein